MIDDFIEAVRVERARYMATIASSQTKSLTEKEFLHITKYKSCFQLLFVKSKQLLKVT